MKLEQYSHVQGIAKKVHSQLGEFITSLSTEESIAQKATELLTEFGAKDTWYYDVPAFVLLGGRSCLSISGKNYTPSTEKVGHTNLVTVDLSPKIGDIWGDCARSYAVEGGIITNTPQTSSFLNGLHTQKKLHSAIREFATPDTKFSELYEYGNQLIEDCGYENLDFLNNLGHSIETDPEARRFIDKNCHDTLGSVSFFTFEPHIRVSAGDWGFKHENIYYFDGRNRVTEL